MTKCTCSAGCRSWKRSQQRRLRDAGRRSAPGRSRGSTPATSARGGRELLLERRHRLLDALGMRQQLLAELGQAIAGRLALHQRLAEAALEFGEPPLHGRLVDAERTTGGERAAVACDGEQMLQVVPVEACGLCAIAAPLCSFAPYAAKPPAPKLAP